MSYNYKISARCCSFYGVNAVWRNFHYFLNMIVQASVDCLAHSIRTRILIKLGTLYDYNALHKGSFSPKYVELFEKCLKF